MGEDTAPAKERIQTVINEIVYADVLKEQEEALAKAKAAEEEARRVTLNKYMDQFLHDIKAGVRLTEKGIVFTDGSIHTTTKRWIEDVLDPKKKGQTKAVIRTKDITYIDILQKKTGHTTPEMLKRDIKADQLDVVQKLTDKYDYFD